MPPRLIRIAHSNSHLPRLQRMQLGFVHVIPSTAFELIAGNISATEILPVNNEINATFLARITFTAPPP